jgi:hypothetical protein
MNQSSFGHCKGCQAPIRFARHIDTERFNALDRDPHPNGNVLLDLQLGRYSILNAAEIAQAHEQGKPLFIPHQATCSNPSPRYGGAARRLSRGRRRKEARA